MKDGVYQPRPDGVVMQLRCGKIVHEGSGWIATFHGKPDMIGNRIVVPVSPELASRLIPDRQYLFSELEEIP